LPNYYTLIKKQIATIYLKMLKKWEYDSISTHTSINQISIRFAYFHWSVFSFLGFSNVDVV